MILTSVSTVSESWINFKELNLLKALTCIHLSHMLNKIQKRLSCCCNSQSCCKTYGRPIAADRCLQKPWSALQLLFSVSNGNLFLIPGSIYPIAPSLCFLTAFSPSADRCVLWLNDASYTATVSKEVNRKCPRRTMIQLSTPYADTERQNTDGRTDKQTTVSWQWTLTLMIAYCVQQYDRLKTKTFV